MKNFHPFEIIFFEKNSENLESFTKDTELVSKNIKKYEFTLSMKILGQYQSFLPSNIKELRLGDVFVDKATKKLYAFCFFKDNGVAAGVKSFGFLDLKTKRFKTYHHFLQEHAPKENLDLIYVSNLYLYETHHKFIDNCLKQDINVLSLDEKTSLNTEKYRKSIINGLLKVVRLSIFKIYGYSSEKEFEFLSKKADISMVLEMLEKKCVWNIFIHIIMKEESYTIERTLISYEPSLKTYTGSIFYYKIDEDVKKLIKKGFKFQEVIDKLNGKYKNKFITTKEVLIYLDSNGETYLKSLNIPYNVVFENDDYLFHFNSIVYKQLRCKTEGLYLDYLLKLL